MLYCPKCRRAYEDGTRRFCDSDGGRLLPAPTIEDSAPPSGGVFSSVLGQTPAASEAENKSKPLPRFVPFNKTEETDVKLTSFPSAGRIFQSQLSEKLPTEHADEAENSILELEPPAADADEVILEFEPLSESAPENVLTESQKPLPRLIRPGEIASGTADVGDRRTNPLGREAFSWKNTTALVGQTVKGRYLIVKQLDEDDEDSVIYLAEDQIFENKKVVVRVFLDDQPQSVNSDEKIFAEERVSLSHLNHPNIAGVFDSGELPEGNEFIVSEFVEGKTLASILKETGEFNALRTARIIRQTSYALSEAHQNGILHRNLKPENIVLTISEAGIEQVKLMNFGVSHGEINAANLAYKAPEEIDRGVSTYASDIYSLAIIAFEMLTKRFPFDFETDAELLKAQKSQSPRRATEFRDDVQPLTDKILEKAFAFNASERYPKARDFGDAFFNALSTVEKSPAEREKQAAEMEREREFVIITAINQPAASVEDSQVAADISIAQSEQAEDPTESKLTDELAWENRSLKQSPVGESWRGWAAIAGAVALLLLFWGASRLYFNSLNQPEKQVQPAPAENAIPPVDNALPQIDGDMAPEPRVRQTPPDAVGFQNSREKLTGAPAKNFLGFEVFYPQDWVKKDTPNDFLDISKRTASDFPIEQMIVTHYASRGTMTLDRPGFPTLAEKSNQDLREPKNLGESYKVISEGETTIQNGRWKAYEVKFQGLTKGEKVTVWGRRFWIPVQTPGKQNGFVITLLATSLSDEVKSVDDVGTKGGLAGVLDTFEPETGNR